jgi:hypothetical protein
MLNDKNVVAVGLQQTADFDFAVCFFQQWPWRKGASFMEPPSTSKRHSMAQP